MRSLIQLLMLGLSSLPLPQAWAQSVSVEEGNIVFTRADGQVVQLTTYGKDYDPSLSPDGKWVVFARHTPDQMVPVGVGDVEASEIWIVRADGSDAKLLVRGEKRDPWEETLAGMMNPTFLSDNVRIVFGSLLWTASGKVSMVDTRTGKVRQVVAGSLTEVVPDAEYRDHLIVNQHRYFLGGGSYDWYWLFDPNGKEVGPIGDHAESINGFHEVFVKPSRAEAR